jgi:hypothetical protein
MRTTRAPNEEFEWGREGVEIALVRALSFELEVVELANGAPVEDYAVVCHGDDLTSSRQTQPRLGGKHPAVG